VTEVSDILFKPIAVRLEKKSPVGSSFYCHVDSPLYYWKNRGMSVSILVYEAKLQVIQIRL